MNKNQVSKNIAVVASVYFSAFTELLTKKGVDVISLLDESCIDKDFLNNSDNYIELSSVLNFLQLAYEKTEDTLIGLHAGIDMHPSQWGVLSYVMQSSSNLGEVLQHVTRYESIINSNIRTKMLIADDLLHQTVYFKDFNDPELVKPLIEYDLSAFLICGEFLVGMPGKSIDYVKEVTFRHAEPKSEKDIQAYEQIFGKNIKFSAETNTISLHLEVLSLPVLTSNIVLIPQLLEHVKGLHERMPNGRVDVIEKIYYLIKTQMYTGAVTKETIAKALGFSISTLQRKLQEHGTTYREVYENVRMKLAIGLLDEGDISLIDISFLLGFSNASSFNTAFKKWTGYTPKNYQKLRLQK